MSARQFSISHDGSLSQATLSHLLHDFALPKLLGFDGNLVLHGGLVSFPAGAVGFIAPSGWGKSTLTASLHRRGFPLMSDDAILLRPETTGWQAERLYPSLRLLPDSLDQLFPDAQDTSPVANYTTKLRVPFAEGPDSAPLAALFRLADPSDDIRISRLSPAQACMAIIANTFALDAADPAEGRRRFTCAAKLAESVPIHDLHYPRDYDRLPEVHDAILATLGLTLPTTSDAVFG